ncbi:MULTISPECIES: hypothetical protein [Pseudoalteromonas]|uniref:hypothetical protein n=1 Tax=Pseudoalteromonas TaxID=53246 RepID=UPI00101FECC7|nr:hypothetical protein [Pseudoalteromonas sp. MEBiC 03485]RZD19672.1 hypothetical protein EVU92_20950 [Pseudoalteromonas sp. MEBiC 03485]
MAITKSIRKEVGMKFQGNPGEELVSYLSSKSGILATPPKQDQFGWDLHFQFSSNLTPIFMDEHESNYNAYVQVKEFTQDYDNYKGRDIKLSNIQHMISSSSPCFVIFAQTTNEELYVVHLGFELIELGLKKIRLAQARNTPLHKSTMRINPHICNAKKVGLSDNLKNVLIDIVGHSPKKYVEEKQSFTKSVGYLDGAIEVIGTLSERELLEVELGLKNSVEVTVEQFNNIRFDTPLPFPFKPLKVELLSNEYAESISVFTNNIPDDEVLFIRKSDDTLPLTLNGKLRISSQSTQFGVFAFDSEFFKLIISEKPKCSLEISFNLHKLLTTQMTLDELRYQMEMASYMFSGDELLYGFKSLDNGECNRCTERASGVHLKEVYEVLQMLDTYEQLLKLLKINKSSPIDPMFLFQKRRKLKTILDIIFNPTDVTLRFPTVSGINSGESVLIFIPFQIKVNNHEYIITVRAQGNMVVFDGQGYLAKGHSHSLMSPILAQKKPVRDLFKKLDHLISHDKESVHKLVIYTAMSKELAVSAKPNIIYD